MRCVGSDIDLLKVLFGLNKMCKAHFHPFAVIISPFPCSGDGGVKNYFFLIFFLGGAPTPWALARTPTIVLRILKTYLSKSQSESSSFR
jgi:hypothetical protein